MSSSTSGKKSSKKKSNKPSKNDDLNIRIDDNEIKPEVVINVLTKKHGDYGAIDQKQEQLNDALVAMEDKLLSGCPSGKKAKLQAITQEVKALSGRPSNSQIGGVYCNAGEAICEWKSGHGVARTRSFPSCLDESIPVEKKAKEAINALAKNFASAKDAAILIIRQDIIDVEVKKSPAGELDRKHKENVSVAFATFDVALLKCPHCKHLAVDLPATDDSSNTHNEEKKKSFIMIAKHVREQLAKNPGQPVMLKGVPCKKVPANPTVKNNQLLPIMAACHCHQMFNIGGDAGGQITCIMCNNDPSLVDGSGDTSCPMCNCDCRRRWQLEHCKEIHDRVTLNKNSGEDQARAQALAAMESQKEPKKASEEIYNHGAEAGELSLRARGLMNLPDHEHNAITHNSAARLARHIATTVGDENGPHQAMVQGFRNTVKPTNCVMLQDPSAHPNQKPFDCRQLGQSSKKGKKGKNNQLSIPAGSNVEPHQKKKHNMLFPNAKPHAQPPKRSRHKVPMGARRPTVSSSSTGVTLTAANVARSRAAGMPDGHFDRVPSSATTASASTGTAVAAAAAAASAASANHSPMDDNTMAAMEDSQMDEVARLQKIADQEEAMCQMGLANSMKDIQTDVLELSDDEDDDDVEVLCTRPAQIAAAAATAATAAAVSVAVQNNQSVASPTEDRCGRIMSRCAKTVMDGHKPKEEKQAAAKLLRHAQSNPSDLRRAFANAQGYNDPNAPFNSPEATNRCGSCRDLMDKFTGPSDE